MDPEVRRRAVVDALLEVVRRDGMAGASVRTVAAQAGLSPGAMRHYVGSQAELIELATRELAERVTTRIRGLGPVRGPEDLVEVLAQVVPLDAERRAETEVWLALVVESRTDERLVPLAEETHAGLRRIAEAGVDGIAPDLPAAAAATEADRLHALIDGLALHGVLHPDQLTPSRARAALQAHLDELGKR